MVQDLDLFIDRLLDEKGLTNLEPTVLQQLKIDLKKRIEDRINVSILNNLPQDKVKVFEELLDKAADNEIQDYIKQNIPNLEQVLAGELMQFRRVYLNL
jgi:hypothetical protein